MNSPAGTSPVAVITGAGTGIGRSLAHRLADAGFDLVLAGRTRETLQSVASELAHTSRDFLIVPVDIGASGGPEKLIAETIKRFGRLDVLVNNAGLARLAPIEQTDESMLHSIFAVNAIGPALTMHHAWPHFVAQKSGIIINVSSMASADPFPGFFAYAAAKAACESLIRSAANEGSKLGIRAFAVAPGAVETGMLRSAFDKTQVPEAICLSPEDVAAVILSCISGKHSAESGRTIYLHRAADGVNQRIA